MHLSLGFIFWAAVSVCCVYLFCQGVDRSWTKGTFLAIRYGVRVGITTALLLGNLEIWNTKVERVCALGL